MGRTTRTPRVGEGETLITAKTGLTNVGISNFGISVLEGATTASYVLDAPVAGARKTLVSISTTSVAKLVRLSVGTDVKVGNQAATQITFNATAAQVVELLGINSTQWVITSASPDAAAVNSTGAVIGTS